jgi:hypothetical protein
MTRGKALETQASDSAISVDGVPVVWRPVLKAHPNSARRISASSGRPRRGSSNAIVTVVNASAMALRDFAAARGHLEFT